MVSVLIRKQLLDFNRLKPIRSELYSALINLSKKRGILPRTLVHKVVDIEGNETVAIGGFSDVYKGTLHSEVVAVKALRSGQKDAAKRLKVRVSSAVTHDRIDCGVTGLFARGGPLEPASPPQRPTVLWNLPMGCLSRT